MDLDTYMADCETRRFEWGTFDCFLYAAGAVEARTGVDHMADLRGYNDETSAAILLQERFSTLCLREAFMQIVAKESPEPIEFERAKNGDIVCVTWPHQFLRRSQIDQSCGLAVYYRNKVIALAPAGLFVVPATYRVVDVWRF